MYILDKKIDWKQGFWLKKHKSRFSSHHNSWNLGKLDDALFDLFFKKIWGGQIAANKKKGPNHTSLIKKRLGGLAWLVESKNFCLFFF